MALNAAFSLLKITIKPRKYCAIKHSEDLGCLVVIETAVAFYLPEYRQSPDGTSRVLTSK